MSSETEVPEGFVSAEFALSLAEMTRYLLDQDSVDSTLERIVTRAVSMIDECDEASIMVLHGRRQLETVAATSEVGRESDRIQTELGQGPCFDAINQAQEVYRVADMDSETRWPQYTPHARALGISSMMGFQLFTPQRTLGALNLYSSQPDVFLQHSEQMGWLFATHAAVAFASTRNDAQLQEAISTRQSIGEALGIIMERYKVTESMAFDMLKKISQDGNIKLRDIASHIVDTGEIPEAGPR